MVLTPLLAVVAGCSLGPQAREPSATYDLGPPRIHASAAEPLNFTLLLPDVGAPAWLDNHGMVYRLNYQNASRAHIYSSSRWTAPPAALLTQRIRSRFAAASGGVTQGIDSARADYILRVDLDDFSQSFDAPGASRVSVRARATLVAVADRKLRAQRSFSVERAAAPDAPGAAAALAEAGDAFVEELLVWAAQALKSGR
jgi:cholesterol transport system auxiliary component